MVLEDIIHLCASSDSNDAIGRTSGFKSNMENNSSESQKTCDNIEDGIFSMEDLGQPKEGNQVAQTMTTNFDKDVSAQCPVQSVKLASLSASQFSEVEIIQSDNNGENSALVAQRGEIGIEMDGVEKPQAECNSKESSVRVLHSSLPSRSKKKLEELLHHWSEWHAKQYASAEDPVDSLESGEETYFPALCVGSDKPSMVSFSMDVHVRKRQRKVSSSLDNDCSPLYDRGYAVGLASDAGVNEESVRDLREAPRCFNCGSYNHSLNDCSKPRDNAAVNSARKQYLSKKSQNSGPRVLTRYYQESPAGKFDGLKPAVLSAETRKLLGLRELDPPPWLNRMRELGYPPGYSEEEDQPSGIAIYGDEESHSTGMKSDCSLDKQKSRKKMTVDFPGINAPIPDNADEMRWAASAGPPCFNFPLNPLDDARNYAQSSNNGHPYGEYRPRNFIDAPPSPLGLGSSPPIYHYPHNFHLSEPFRSRGVPVPGSPHYGMPSPVGRPFLHYDYGSF